MTIGDTTETRQLGEHARWLATVLEQWAQNAVTLDDAAQQAARERRGRAAAQLRRLIYEVLDVPAPEHLAGDGDARQGRHSHHRDVARDPAMRFHRMINPGAEATPPHSASPTASGTSSNATPPSGEPDGGFRRVLRLLVHLARRGRVLSGAPPDHPICAHGQPGGLVGQSYDQHEVPRGQFGDTRTFECDTTLNTLIIYGNSLGTTHHRLGECSVPGEPHNAADHAADDEVSAQLKQLWVEAARALRHDQHQATAGGAGLISPTGFRDGVTHVADGLVVGAPGTWRGAAADDFHDRHSELRQRWHATDRCLAEVSVVLTDSSDALTAQPCGDTSPLAADVALTIAVLCLLDITCTAAEPGGDQLLDQHPLFERLTRALHRLERADPGTAQHLVRVAAACDPRLRVWSVLREHEQTLNTLRLLDSTSLGTRRARASRRATTARNTTEIVNRYNDKVRRHNETVRRRTTRNSSDDPD